MRVSKPGLGLLLWLFIATAQALTFPTLSGRVVDDGQMLDPATRQQLAQTLEAHEKATGEQVVVVTVADLQGTPIEDFGYQLGRAWGIGQKDKNNGALLIVSRDDRKLRIEVGYGLEGRLTDAQCAVVTGNDQQGTVVFVLLTDAPGAPQLVAEVFNGGALQIRHGHYHHLLAGGFFVGFKRLRQLLTRGGIEHLPVVHYPSVECGKCQRLGRGYK